VAGAADLLSLTIADAVALFGAGELSATELTTHCLARIDALDPQLHAFVTVSRERALADARAADARLATARESFDDSDPLLGIPIALKDLIATKGIRTTAGSRVLDEWVPDADAVVARNLADAGTVLLGKTNTHEFAYGTFTPPTRNPWDLTRIPGGSSGGSAAAVAAGMCLAAIGSDTGGSIRIPSGCCGVTGLKPTHGVVSADGVVPLSWSLDHVGPIGRSTRDCAAVLDALTAFEPFEPLKPLKPLPGTPVEMDDAEVHYLELTDDLYAHVRGLRLGVPSNYFFAHVEPEVESAVRAAIRVLSGLGAEIEDVRVPASIDDLFAVYRAIQQPEATTAHVDAGWFPARADLYTPRVRANLERGATYSATDYIRAQRAKQAFTDEMETLFERVDALLTPTLPLVAPRIADIERPLTVAGREEDAREALLRFTFPFDISGQPALTVPCGLSGDGLPVGLQIVARRYDEAMVLRVGQAYQRDTDWHLRRPTL
jgi:aspartyl-tRNA(Asn)/glutamyl-tRNA(Gln) amidotransferase subunit A